MTQKEQTELVCKIGQGKQCCRYLIMAPTGWECGKLSDIKPVIDARVAEGSFSAQSDNCEGIDFKTLEEGKGNLSYNEAAQLGNGVILEIKKK